MFMNMILKPERRRPLEQIDREFYVLRNKEQYTRERGLVIDVSRGDAVMF